MNDLWSKVRDFVGFNDPVDGLDEFEETEEEDYQSLYEGQHKRGSQLVEDENEKALRAQRRAGEWSSDTASRRSGRERTGSTMSGNVIGLPSVNQVTSEVMVVEPRSFDEMAQVVQNLRERKTVIMNLSLMDPTDAQRSVDFVAGGTYAIDGHQERIGENIFLFTPSCVTVTTPSSEEPIQIPMQTSTPIWSASTYSDPPHAMGQR